MRSLLAVMLAAVFATSALAQSPPPPPAPPPAAAPGAPVGAAPPPPSKRASCRAQGQSQGLRGQQLKDQVQLCVQAARTACLNEAIAKNVRGPDRKAFMRSCTG
jgi:hypothetical protein